MVERFVEVCKMRTLKANAGKGKVMALNGEEGLECEVCIDGIHLEHHQLGLTCINFQTSSSTHLNKMLNHYP